MRKRKTLKTLDASTVYLPEGGFYILNAAEETTKEKCKTTIFTKVNMCSILVIRDQEKNITLAGHFQPFNLDNKEALPESLRKMKATFEENGGNWEKAKFSFHGGSQETYEIKHKTILKALKHTVPNPKKLDFKYDENDEQHIQHDRAGYENLYIWIDHQKTTILHDSKLSYLIPHQQKDQKARLNKVIVALFGNTKTTKKLGDTLKEVAVLQETDNDGVFVKPFSLEDIEEKARKLQEEINRNFLPNINFFFAAFIALCFTIKNPDAKLYNLEISCLSTVILSLIINNFRMSDSQTHPIDRDIAKEISNNSINILAGSITTIASAEAISWADKIMSESHPSAGYEL